MDNQQGKNSPTPVIARDLQNTSHLTLIAISVGLSKCPATIKNVQVNWSKSLTVLSTKNNTWPTFTPTYHMKALMFHTTQQTCSKGSLTAARFQAHKRPPTSRSHQTTLNVTHLIEHPNAHAGTKHGNGLTASAMMFFVPLFLGSM